MVFKIFYVKNTAKIVLFKEEKIYCMTPPV